jgi:hypothetical protein
MRRLFALSALFILATAAPAMAHDYPWCARTKGSGPYGDCSFVSMGQWMATVSGQRGDCTLNPRMAYGQYRGGRRGPAGWDSQW